MLSRVIPAIMSGGTGARLWPLSTDTTPKQFRTLLGDRSLFAQTLARVTGDAEGVSFAPPIILCGDAHTQMVRAALEETGVSAATIVIEPAARNTAAIAAVAAAMAQAIDPNALVLLLPSDHRIADVGAFHRAIALAAPFARERIVTFAMAATHAATGYGYIKRGRELGDGVFAIEAFKEKPDAAVARGYVEDGGYLWNCGLFLFSPAVLLAELGANPEIREHAIEAVRTAQRDGDLMRLGGAYARAPSLPIDVAVMERTAKGAVVPSDIGWADIGSWDEIWRLASKDAGGNAAHGSVAILDAQNNLLHAEGVTLAVAGVDNLVVVATRDAVLVVPRERAQDVKRLRDLARKPP
jgi:mannose-1-phosphate guanylyltransferase/mannose-6-phosphate isomerase